MWYVEGASHVVCGGDQPCGMWRGPVMWYVEGASHVVCGGGIAMCVEGASHVVCGGG